MVAKKFQVFVSSTFTDLVEERKRIIEAILDLDCIPAGMELFPSASQKALDIIKKVIDDSDYYILIIGGRYGSVDESGLSYTELEYDYAGQANKYVLPFLHGSPENISVKKSDTGRSSVSKLNKFKEKIQKNHHCKYWADSSELFSAVNTSLAVAIRKSPGEGWVRGGHAVSDEMLEEYKRLKIENEVLRKKISDRSYEISGGDDVFSFEVDVKEYRSIDRKDQNVINKFDITVEFTWNEILNKCGSEFIVGRNIRYLKPPLERMIFEKFLPGKNNLQTSLRFQDSVIKSILIQFIALGYLEPVPNSGKSLFQLTDVSRKIWSTNLAIKKTN